MNAKKTSMDAKVYGKLAQYKRGSDSFSRVMDQMVEQAINRYMAAQATTYVATQPRSSKKDAEVVEKKRVVQENETDQGWSFHNMA